MSFAPRSLISSKGMRCAHSRLRLPSCIDAELARSFPLLPFCRGFTTAQSAQTSSRHEIPTQNTSRTSPFEYVAQPRRRTPAPATRSSSPSSSNASSSNAASRSSPTGPSENAYTTQFKAKRQWPPDLTKLSPKQQFRLERKYRRRAKLKWARPTWSKWTKLVQWSLIGFVLVYAVMFMEIEGGRRNPFGEVSHNPIPLTLGTMFWETMDLSH
ncbi:hypothetical protein FQN49_001312 [Arthroderma sp. PD_2]|nr:hypothetical protein FQN49_001312 [Arthroderma sp. PD_2]